MKLSLKWLSQFVDLSGLSTEDIINEAVHSGFEVESVETLGQGTNLVVGKVIECHDHPDSDHLHVTKVDIGSEVLDIVCGAPNCRNGLKVIVAKVGAKLPLGEIKASTIRGVASNGMLCSLLELGIRKELLDDNSPSLNGIEELGDEFEVGDENILDRLGYEDDILDVSIYANRPDCLGMFAMAKEMAAILNRKCTLPDFEGKADIGEETKFHLESKTDNCPHFLAKVVRDVTIKPSPKWMRDHLLANGIKSINNLIDISNYVMLETGQPMHFYDLRMIPNEEITVVDDYEGEYTALDGITYNIEKGDVMITNDGVPSGIAGIMGGDNTKILDDTTGIVIECALFSSAAIRRTSNRIGLQTEAAMRFSKGLEPLAQKKAMDRAIDLLIELADAKGIEKTVEWGSDNYTPYTVKETVEHINSVIGKTYTTEEVVDVLNRLDFKPTIEGEYIVAHIPSYRSVDIKIREDIDEEVIRLTGYDDLGSTLALLDTTIGKLSKRQSMRRTIRNVLTYAGLNEAVSYTLVNEKYNNDTAFALGDSIALLSPLSDARKYIRTGLMNSSLENLSYNLAHGNENVNLYEISTVYAEGKQSERLSVILNGKLSESKVMHNSIKASFYVLKGLVMELLDHMGFESGRVTVVENNLDVTHFHPYQSCLIRMNNKTIGILGRVHPKLEKEWKTGESFYCELDLEELVNSNPVKIKALEVNRYPSITRDISLVVEDDVKARDLLKVTKKAGGKLVKSVEVFDVYKGEHIKEGYKSVSINIVYESSEKTLKIEDINPVHEKVLNELNKVYNANLRS